MKSSEIAERDLAEWGSYSEAEHEAMRRAIPEADDFPQLCRDYLRLREAALNIKKYGSPDDSHRILGDYVVPKECIETLVVVLEENDE